jgi:hypothetical protein
MRFVTPDGVPPRGGFPAFGALWSLLLAYGLSGSLAEQLSFFCLLGLR